MNSSLVTGSAYKASLGLVRSVRDELDQHARLTWGQAHGGLAAQDQNYSNSNSQVVASKVVPIEVAGVRYYVPAQRSSGVDVDVQVPGLYSTWKHDDQTGSSRLDSVSGRHLTQVGGVSRVDGKFGGASQLGAGKRLWVKADQQFDLGIRSFTFTLWVKLTTLGASDQVILAKAKTSATSDVELALVVREQTGVHHVVADIGNGTAVSSVSNSVNLATSTWYFVAVSYDTTSGQAAVTVNSTRVSGPARPVSLAASPDISFGAYGGGLSTLDGQIDSTRFFQRSLSQEELSMLYGGGNGPAVGQTGVGSVDAVVSREDPEQQHLVSSRQDYTKLDEHTAVARSNLQSHESSRIPSVHGQFQPVSRVTLDSAGYVVGRFLLQFKHLAGYAGLICDTRPDGPPKLVKLASSCPTGQFTSFSNVSTSLVPTSTGCSLRIISKGDSERWGQVALIFNVTAGTGPIKYQWEWSENGTFWQEVNPTIGAVTRNAGLRPIQDSSGNWAHVGELSSAPVTLTTLWNTVSPGGDNGVGWSMRCKFDNSVVGGGVVYSNVITCYIQDSSPKYLCTLAYDLGLLEFSNLVLDRSHATRLGKQAYAGYRVWASPLSRWFTRHPLVFKVIAAKAVVAFARHAAALEVGNKGSLLGRLVYAVGVPVCRLIGRFTRS